MFRNVVQSSFNKEADVLVSLTSKMATNDDAKKSGSYQVILVNTVNKH